jgi:hypothetical protein
LIHVYLTLYAPVLFPPELNLAFIFQLALSAACPVWRAYLSDIDGRYMLFSEAMDDRTDTERGNGHGVSHIGFLRYFIIPDQYFLHVAGILYFEGNATNCSR